jgi:archaellin
VKWQYLLVTVILIAMVCAPACTDEETSGPAPEARSPIQPGQVMVAIGDVTGNGTPRGTIDTITFRVGLAAGGKSVKMENVSIVYADAVRMETLRPVAGLRGYPPPGSWGVIEVKNEEGTPNNRLEYDEEFVIQINPKAPLVPRQFIMIVVEPPSGTSLTLRRVTPPAILGGKNILAAL